VLDACPDLKICANMAVGYNNFDVDAMTAHGVLGTNAPDVLTETTADFGFALLMATARRITESEHFLRAGKWKKWSYDMFAGSDIHGSHAGHPRHGPHRAGHREARRARLRHEGDLSQPLAARRSARSRAARPRYVGKEELLKTADHLVLVVPYSAASHHTIGAAELALMKPTATLVNIARGGIVDDAALAAGAAREAHRRRRPRRVRGRAQGASRPADRAQRGAHAAHRERHRAHAPRHGRPGGRQPDRLLQRQGAAHR
jgi:gluconate 2-dehydrogenase